MSLFLTPDEVTQLTGIKKGRGGKTRAQLQCEFLRRSGVPFTANVRGEPIIARAIIEGNRATSEPVKTRWQSAALLSS